MPKNRFRFSTLLQYLRIGPLGVQICTIVLAGVFVISASLVTSRIITARSESSGSLNDAARMTSEMDSRLGDLQKFLSDVGDRPAQLDIQTAFAAHDTVASIEDDAVTLSQLTNSPEATEINRVASEVSGAVNFYFTAQSDIAFRNAQSRVSAMKALLKKDVIVFTTQSDQDEVYLEKANSTSRMAVIGVALITTLIVVITSYILGRRVRMALHQTLIERDNLAEVTAAVQKRNQQFDALYQIVNEISDSLSMKYVVKTTVEEARKLVNADYVELRLIGAESLSVLGTSDPNAVTSPLPLGTGLAGKAAKRGKTLRLQSLAGVSLADQERELDMRSALVVPLIVGARVLGTLSCWSREESSFDNDDERILELMASQVATAVAAADIHQTSEHRATHDPLTGLPNRRQLLEDTGELDKTLDADQHLAVAMLDVDHFKRFNDDFGHRVGDVTLQKVAEVMRASLRDADRVYRYGGEEFLVVLKGVRRSDATRLIERLRRSVERTLLTGEQLEPVGPVTISGWIALGPEHGRTLSDLVKAADDALYVSKANGRNRITVVGAVTAAAA